MDFFKDVWLPGAAIVAGTAVGGPAGGAAAAGLVGGIKSAEGQEDANNANIASAKQQQDFQERMRNTAHQSQVNDLRAAGLNPILGVNSGASTPSGSMATSQSITPGLQSGFNSAIAAFSLKKDLELKNEQIQLTEAQKIKTRSEAEIAKTTERDSDLIQRAKEGDISLYGDNRGHENVPNYYKGLVQSLEQQNTASAKEAHTRMNEASARDSEAEVRLRHSNIDKKFTIPDAILRRLNEAVGPAGTASKIYRGK